MKKLYLAVLVVFAGLLGACVDKEGIKPDYDEISSHRAALSAISSCDTYKDYVLDVAARQIAEQRFGYGYRYWLEDAVAEPEAPSADNDGKSAGEFTSTNIQEAGVDEMDMIKNDGTYFYLLNNTDFHVVQVWPPTEMKSKSKISFKHESSGPDNTQTYEYPQGLFLVGKTAVILTSYWSYTPVQEDGSVKGWYYYSYYRQFTRAIFVDVSNSAAPKITKTLEFPSDLFSARLIGSQLYLALKYSRQAINTYEYRDVEMPGVPKAFENYDSWEKSREYVAKYTPAIRAYLEKVAKDWDIFALFPKIKIINSDNSKSEQSYISCNDFYIPATASKQSGILSIVTINVSNPSQVHSTSIADSSWLLYASQKNIYLVSSSNNWFTFWDSADAQARENYSQIHQFSLLPELSRTQYMASGEVRGIVNNPFWLSEYKDHLRVTSQAGWWSDAENGNSLTILKREGTELKETGKITDIAKGESIYAARMFGDKGYLVTFKRIDPLFTLDLSNPAAPKIMGELKINGYSSYIHPLEDGYLLTIGEDSDDEGRVIGLHLQVFDVRDMKNPVRVQHELLERSQDSYSYSAALYDHHAFTYHAGSQTLVIPFNEYNWSYWGGKSFSGMLVYKVSPQTGFKRLGLIDHSEFIKSLSDYKYWWVNLTRSRIYFGTAGVYDKDAYVYTLSNLGLKVNDLIDLQKDLPVVGLE